MAAAICDTAEEERREEGGGRAAGNECPGGRERERHGLVPPRPLSFTKKFHVRCSFVHYSLPTSLPPSLPP